jgi:hypothetical protein
VASLLAVCGWLGGDGALARVALERAQLADPGYSLAALLGAALDGGLPPWSWSSMMAEVSVERILATGDGPPRSAPGARVDVDDRGGLDAFDELTAYDDYDDTWCADPGCAACRCAQGTAGDAGPDGPV